MSDLPEGKTDTAGQQPLTEANLAEHHRAMTEATSEYSAFQVWLDSTEDKPIQARDATDWQDLIARDELAAEVDVEVRKQR
ncbi:hypothetical protein LTR85_005070 [Meristemomyces frigidus]|nr:hypothetical protein LTR85_005070 [Meristemomyces frigidus]